MQKEIKKQQVKNNRFDFEEQKGRKGDTGRSSTQGRKEASGGSAETNNRGHDRNPRTPK
jgi:hypothetical protein